MYQMNLKNLKNVSEYKKKPDVELMTSNGKPLLTSTACVSSESCSRDGAEVLTGTCSRYALARGSIHSSTDDIS